MNDQDIINALPDKPKPLSDSEILGALPDKKDPAKASFELTSAYDPERTAKVQKLSAQFDKPAPFIDAHLEDAEKAANAPEDKFWADLKAMYPSTHKWLADPNNMAVAHDDIESLKAFEDKVAHASYLGRLYYGLNSGMASMWSGVSRIPAYAYKVAALPQNAIVTAMGRPDLQVNAPKWLMDNPVAKYYDRNAEAFKTPEMSQSTSQLITEGRYSDAAKTALMGIVANAPQQVPLLLAAASGYGAAGLVGMGALQAAQTSKENQDAGADPLASTMNATLQGTFEAAWERVGTLGIFKSIESNAIRQFGKENGMKFTKELAKELFLHTAGEGAEEFGTQVSQDWSAKITGVNPDAMTGTLGRAIDAGIIGWGSGITMTAPGAMSSAYGKVLESKQAEATKKAYLAMGSSLEAGKLRARLPEAQRHFVESVTKDGPIENIYLDREPAEVYFQSKGIDPEQAFQQMGATAEAVKLSKETGAPLKISMADWANNVVGTEHYNALADDVAFGPYEPTVRKVNAKKAEVTAALKAIDEQIKTDEVAKTDYEKVHAALKEDQVRLGVKESEADAVAKVAARRMMYLAKAEGKSIDEILGDRPKATSPMEYKYGFDKSGKPLVELTPEEIRDIDIQNHMEVVREMGGVTPIMDAVREFGGIDYEKVKRDSLGSNMPEANLGAGIYRKGGKSVSEMAGALVRAGKAPEGWDEIELADAIDKEMRESAKFISQYGEGRYKKLRRETLYQAAVEKALTGTKVVDAQGKPLPVFHGTDKGFSSFEVGREGNVSVMGFNAKTKRHAIFFAEDSTLAGEFATQGEQSNGVNIRKAYLNIKHPLDLSKRLSDVDFRTLLGDEENPGIKKSLLSHIEDHPTEAWKLFDADYDGAKNVEFLKSLEWDGVKMVERSEGDAENTTAWAVFDPSQVVNAIGVKDPSLLMQSLSPITYFQSAWHGSPHDFEKFSLHAIGTGEGAQAYGYGLYFAGDKAVAEFYRRELVKSAQDSVNSIVEALPKSQNPTSDDVYFEIKKHPNLKEFENSSEFKRDILEIINGSNDDGTVTEAAIRAMRRTEGYLPKSAGKLYEVNIPEDDVLLDWDKSWEQQSDKVKEILSHSDLANKLKSQPNGQYIYGTIGTIVSAGATSNDKAASEYLNSLGIKGIKYLDGNSRNVSNLEQLQAKVKVAENRIKYAKENNNAEMLATWEKNLADAKKDLEGIKHNYVIFDDGAIEILNRYYQAAQDNNENARGFYDVVNNLLVRGNKADASTYWHEFSHYYLDRLFKAANSGKASESFMGDWAVIAKWLGVTKDQKELTREQHEQFARGSEAYLRGDDYSVEKMAGGRYSVISAMSGKSLREFKTKAEAEKWIKKNTIKAPSKELKSAFTRFRVWLTKVYKSVRDLNVELPDDVRGVFDKMLAAEDGITEAEKDLGLDKIGEGLNEADASKLKAIHKEAHDEAVELLTRHLLTSVKKSSKEEREKYRRKVEDGMRLKLIEERVYKAIRLMDPDPLKRAQDYIDSKLQPKDGIQVSLTAEMLGYSSGDEMCKDVLAAKPLEVAVKEQTDRIMAAYDESEGPEVLKARAEELVHSDKNVELMTLEAMLVRSRIFGREITEAERERGMAEASVEVALTKKAANEILAEMNVVEAANPSSFARMERDAAAKAAAAMAVKDYAKFVIYKRRQRTCHAMYSKSVDIKRRLDKRMTRIDKILKKPLDSFKDQDSFNQIGMLMMRFNFGLLKHWMPDGKGPTLPEYIKQVNGIFSDPLNPGEVSDGILAIPEWIVSGMSKSWRDMSWAEFQDATDAIENLIHAANKVDSFFKIRNKATLSAVGDELVNKAYTSIKNVIVQKVEQSGWDRAKHLLNDYLYRLDGVDALTQRLDGYGDGGIWQQIFLDPMREQAGLEDKKMREMRDALKELWAKCYTPEEAKAMFSKQEFYDDLKASMTKSKVIAMALNMGALENRSKLFSNPITGTFPDAWNEEAVNRFLEQNLTAKDCEFVQGVWDIINSLWPDVAAMQEDLTGFEPLKVEAVPFTLNLAEGKAFQFRGGYFPLKADPNANDKAGEKAYQREIADEPLYTEQNSAYRAMTKTGHTKKRSGANYTLLMDLGLIDRHVRDVVHDLYFRGLVFDLRRLLARENVQMAIKSTLGPEAYRALLQHVNSYATGANAEKLSSNGLDVAIRWVNQRVSRVVIVGKVSVIVQNLANVVLAGNAVEGFSHWDSAKAILFRGIGGYWRPGAFYQAERNKTLQFVWERSEFMRAKRMSPDYSLNDVKEGKLDDHQTVKEFFLGLMAGTDDLTNVPVWLEMYHKRIKEGANEGQAIKEADLLVSRISGSGRKYDQALITKGSDLERLFAKFYTFWNIEYANWLRNLNQFERDRIKNAPRFAGFVASRMVFIWASAMLVGGAPGDDEDKKKAWWWKQYLAYPLSFFPVFRDLAAAPINELVGLPSYGYRAAPVFSMPSTVVKTGVDMRKWVYGDKETDKMLESATKSAAYVGGYPDQFNTWFWNAYDAAFNGMELRPQDVMVRRPAKER